MNSWQDWAIFIGQVVLALTLWPSISAGIVLPLLTVVPAVLIMGLFFVVFASLNMKASAASSALGLAFWSILLYIAVR